MLVVPRWLVESGADMTHFRPLSILSAALCVASVVILAPWWAALVLAAWCADLLRPLVGRLERPLGGRRLAAAEIECRRARELQRASIANEYATSSTRNA